MGLGGAMRRGGESTYPRMVRRTLIKKSAPQPATMYTPIGGTIFNVSLPFHEGGVTVSCSPKRVMSTRKSAETKPMLMEACSLKL